MKYNKNVFPKEPDKKDYIIQQQNLQIQAYGRRITKDQTVPEYLLEFLLVFISENKNLIGFDKFYRDGNDIDCTYTVNPNIGLKRFIFFENSKLENRYNIDKSAYEKLKDLLKDKIESEIYNKEDVLAIIQELFYGFSAVTKNRGWFAQSLMPICKEVIFPEAMGKKGDRQKLDYEQVIKADSHEANNLYIDKKFQFTEYNFMAKGGEVYYLHLMQYLENDSQMKKRIQKNIFRLIEAYPELSILSNWIINIWNQFLCEISNKTIGKVEETLKQNMNWVWIPNRYKRRSKYSAQEVDNLLLCEASEFEKMDLLNVGIVMQILRMMVESAKIISDETDDKINNSIGPMWLIHVSSESNLDKKIKKLAVESYKQVEWYMEDAIAKILIDCKDIEPKKTKKKKSDLLRIKDANEDSFKLLRKLGKDIGLIIPLKGDNMRFSIDDSVIRFLVLSLIKPESKVTLNTFLNRLYEHYGIVIGPVEYELYAKENNIEEGDISFLNDNLMEFQKLLRNNGFLRELSDATSIVENTYRKVRE